MSREGRNRRGMSAPGVRPKAPIVGGFTPEEFKMLDFARIDLSEWYGDIEAKAQDQIESEMEESVEDFYDRLSP